MENIWIICIFIFGIIVLFHVHSMSYNVLSNVDKLCVYYKMFINVDMCDAAQVWGGPRAREHTKECLLPRRLGC